MVHLPWDHRHAERIHEQGSVGQDEEPSLYRPIDTQFLPGTTIVSENIRSCNWIIDSRTSLLCTNSGSMATRVPGLGNSSNRRHLCLIRFLSRFLHDRSYQ